MSTPPLKEPPFLGIASSDAAAFLDADTFKFLVGRGKRSFTIHKPAFARVSPALDRLMNGSMKEAREGYVVLDDVEESIFSRCAQFVYAGTYPDFEPTPIDAEAAGAGSLTLNGMENKKDAVLSRSSSDPDPKQTSDYRYVSVGPDWLKTMRQELLDRDLYSTHRKLTPFGIPRSRPEDGVGRPFSLPYSTITCMHAASKFLEHHRNEECRSWNDCYGNVPDIMPFPSPRKLTAMVEFNAAWFMRPEAGVYGVPGRLIDSETLEPACCHDSVFLGHAKVFVFADKYAIQPLMDYAVVRLARALGCWVIHKASLVSDLGCLVNYVYENSLPGSQLRVQVTQFAACIFEDVSDLDDWQDFLAQQPEFALDLLKTAATRV